MPDAPTARSRYNHTAWFYETMSSFYSRGRIRQAKLAQLPHIAPGDKVLYAGAGAGEDVAEAARKGAEVTCIELAPAMASRIERRLETGGMSAEVIQGDIMDHRRPAHYDAVCANFFLNVFEPPVMEAVMDHLIECLKEGGKMMIADFAPPDTWGRAARSFQRAYHGYANVLFRILARNPVHPVYDYEALLAARGLQMVDSVGHSLFRGWPPSFQTLVAARGGA